MAKRYNITFNNESEYLSFKASSAYYEPNVSLTLDDNKVHFNPAPISVTGVSLDSSSIEISEGEAQSLVATVFPANATDKSVTWSTSDSSVATVDANGLVTAVANGNCTITVTTNDGGYTAQCTVEVATLETKVVAKFSVYDTSSPTQIIGEDWDEGGYSSAFTAIEIDGVAQPSVVSAYTFSTTGEHTVKYTLADTTTLGLYAFCSCTRLTSVTIPSGVTTIGYEAFYDCSSLTSIIIPNSVTTIGDDAFYECSSLSSITVDSNNTTYDSRNNCNAIIETASNTLVVGCKSTVIPNSVTIIGNSAFYYCIGLTSIDIPSSVRSVGFEAFGSCISLTSIAIPNSVTSIGNEAFYECTNLTSCTIGSGVTSIGSSVFYSCNSLSSITVDSNNTVYDSRNNCNAIIKTSTNTLVQGCKTTMIPNSVTSIGDGAFRFCRGLTSIVIPNSVTSIGNSAFYSCYNLTSCTIGSGVTSIGSSVFYSCSLTSIDIPSGVTSISGNAFYYCNHLTSVTVNATTPPTLGSSAFNNTNNCPIYVPSGSVSNYKSATNWSSYSSRIQAIT